MAWHLFGGLGMMPFNIDTDPGLPNFMARAKARIPDLVLHGPFRDYQSGQIAAEIDKLPPEDHVFVVGTSLSANDVFIVCGYTKRQIKGAFMFQASSYGPASEAPPNVEFAHLIYSFCPLPLPFLGTYKPLPGHLIVADRYAAGVTYVQTLSNDPHPGDGVLKNQMLFIADMERIKAQVV